MDDGTCLGEPPEVLVMLIVDLHFVVVVHLYSFVDVFHFVDVVSSFDFQATSLCDRHSTLASQTREGLHQL